MAYTDQAPPPSRQPPGQPDPAEYLDFDRLATNVLLTVQALQALHQAFDKRFTR